MSSSKSVTNITTLLTLVLFAFVNVATSAPVTVIWGDANAEHAEQCVALDPGYCMFNQGSSFLHFLFTRQHTDTNISPVWLGGQSSTVDITIYDKDCKPIWNKMDVRPQRLYPEWVLHPGRREQFPSSGCRLPNEY
jgi:hypothetical protein